ncbi:hypothetical protein IG631_08250 [Alternaria alternata]|nr:hypothetical protein IG631_08250 [Alternaria alternata]
MVDRPGVSYLPHWHDPACDSITALRRRRPDSPTRPKTPRKSSCRHHTFLNPRPFTACAPDLPPRAEPALRRFLALASVAATL